MSFIQANLDKYTVKQMCSALKFPRSTYYAALNLFLQKENRNIRNSAMKYYQYITNLRNVMGQLRSIENLMIEISPAQKTCSTSYEKA